MNAERRRAISFLLAPLLNGIVLGAIVGGLMVYIAVQHNPQGEFYDSDLHTLAIKSAVWLFCSWFLPVATIVFVIEAVTSLFWRWIRR